jgi:hypothetical protein
MGLPGNRTSIDVIDRVLVFLAVALTTRTGQFPPEKTDPPGPARSTRPSLTDGRPTYGARLGRAVGRPVRPSPWIAPNPPSPVNVDDAQR